MLESHTKCKWDYVHDILQTWWPIFFLTLAEASLNTFWYFKPAVPTTPCDTRWWTQTWPRNRRPISCLFSFPFSPSQYHFHDQFLNWEPEIQCVLSKKKTVRTHVLLSMHLSSFCCCKLLFSSFLYFYVSWKNWALQPFNLITMQTFQQIWLFDWHFCPSLVLFLNWKEDLTCCLVRKCSKKRRLPAAVFGFSISLSAFFSVCEIDFVMCLPEWHDLFTTGGRAPEIIHKTISPWIRP